MRWYIVLNVDNAWYIAASLAYIDDYVIEHVPLGPKVKNASVFVCRRPNNIL